MELVGKLMPGAAVFTATGGEEDGWSTFTNPIRQRWAALSRPNEVRLEPGTYLLIWLKPEDGVIARQLNGQRAGITIAGGSHMELVSDTSARFWVRLAGTHTDASLVVLRL